MALDTFMGVECFFESMLPIIALNETFDFAVMAVLSGIVGLCVGSFLNVVIYRVPLGMSLSTPPSHCTSCGYKLKWYDNIPVLSYLMLGGKCRNCHAHISFRYTAVEILNTLLWLLSAFLWRGNILMSFVAMFASSIAICVFFIDWEQLIIPDRFQILLGISAIPATLLDTYDEWYSHLIGGAVGFLLFFMVGKIVSKATGHESLGGGDVKFALVAGLFLGWKRLILMLLLASLGGCIFALFAKKKKGDRTFPFAPFLTVGFSVAMFAGSRLITAYLKLF